MRFYQNMERTPLNIVQQVLPTHFLDPGHFALIFSEPIKHVLMLSSPYFCLRFGHIILQVFLPFRSVFGFVNVLQISEYFFAFRSLDYLELRLYMASTLRL